MPDASALLLFTNLFPHNYRKPSCIHLEDLKDLFNVHYSEEGCNLRSAELQAWVHFGDFQDACEGSARLFLFV